MPGATVARISGDEFAVVLAGVAWPWRATWRPRRCGSCATSATPPSRCPAALAAAGPGTERPEPLMRAADAAQYAAKRRGGAQVCSAGVDDFHELLAAGEGAGHAPPRPPPQPGRAHRGRLRPSAGAAGRQLAQRATAGPPGGRRQHSGPAGQRRRVDHLVRRARASTDPLAGRRRRPRLAAARHARGPGGRGLRAGRLPGHRAAGRAGQRHVPRGSLRPRGRPRRAPACWTRSATRPCWPPRRYRRRRLSTWSSCTRTATRRELAGLAVSLSLLVRAAAANSASAAAAVASACTGAAATSP